MLVSWSLCLVLSNFLFARRARNCECTYALSKGSLLKTLIR